MSDFAPGELVAVTWVISGYHLMSVRQPGQSELEFRKHCDAVERNVPGITSFGLHYSPGGKPLALHIMTTIRPTHQESP
jgi:hypothetical protein